MSPISLCSLAILLPNAEVLYLGKPQNDCWQTSAWKFFLSQIPHQTVGSAGIDCSWGGVHFSRDFIGAFNDRITIRENKELWTAHTWHTVLLPTVMVWIIFKTNNSTNRQLRPQGFLLSCAGKIETPGQVQRLPVWNGFVNTIDWDLNQSDLSDLTLSMRRVTGSRWIVDFRSWTWPEVMILVANQKDRGLWEQDCTNRKNERAVTCYIVDGIWTRSMLHKLGCQALFIHWINSCVTW